MSHARAGHIGRRPGFPHAAHPGGWWKFGIVVLLSSAAAVTFVRSPLLRSSAPETAPGITISPVALGPSASIKPPAATTDSPALPAAPQLATPPVAATGDTSMTDSGSSGADTPAGQNIRDVDFAALPAMQLLSRQLGAQVDTAGIIYTDLTGDAKEEAIVPITSNGTYGTLAFLVFTERANAPQAVLTRLASPQRRGLVVTIVNGQLTETSGVYGPKDADCCPSQIVRTYFRWDGQNLVFDHTTTINVPQGKDAD